MKEESDRRQGAQTSRLKIEDLRELEKELSAEELKQIQGGVIRSVGNKDGGGSTNANPSGGAGEIPNLVITTAESH